MTVPEETEEEKNKRITAANTYEVSPQRRVFTKATLAAPDYKTPTSLQSDNTSVSVPVSTVAEQEAIQAQKEAEVRQRIYNNTVRPVSNQEMSDVEHGHRAEEWMLKPANERLNDATNAALITAGAAA